MSENSNQPREYDAVIGGQNQPPVDGLVLGGLAAVERQLASPEVTARMVALPKLLQYGETGTDLVIKALQDRAKQVQFSAYQLLRDNQEPKVKQAIQHFNPYRFFECLHTFRGVWSSRRAVAIAIAPNGKDLIFCWGGGNVGKTDGTGYVPIKCIVANFRTNQTLSNHSVKFGSLFKDSLAALILTPNAQTLIAAGVDYSRLGDTRIEVLDVQTGQLIHLLYGHSAWGTYKEVTLAVSQDSKILVSGTQDKTVIVWDLQTGHKLHTLEGHENSITALAISPDGETLVSASKAQIIVWNLKNGRNILTIDRSVYCLKISQDGETLISGNRAGNITFWSLMTGKELYSLIPFNEVGSLSLSLDQILISSGGDKSRTPIQIWNLALRENLATLTENSKPKVALSTAISPDGQTIVSFEQTYVDNTEDSEPNRVLGVLNARQFIKVWGVPNKWD